MADFSEAQKAVGYAGFGAVILKGIEIFLKSLSSARHDSAKELELTFEASAKIREALDRDNASLRSRVSKLEERLEKLENEHLQLREINFSLKNENTRLKAELSLRAGNSVLRAELGHKDGHS